MPAFSPTHDEREIWSMVAFVRHLPKIDEREKEQLARSVSGASRKDGEGHAHGDEAS